MRAYEPKGAAGSVADLALAVATHFGAPGNPELKQVRRIVGEFMEARPECDRPAGKEDIGHVQARYKAMPAAERRSLANLDRAVAHIASAHPDLRRFAFECVVRIVACRERELQALNPCLHTAARGLGLDAETVRSVRDRHLRVGRIVGASAAARLGAEPSWGTGRLGTFLRDEHRKWNGRVAHPDPEIAEEAIERVHLIGEAAAALGRG